MERRQRSRRYFARGTMERKRCLCLRFCSRQLLRGAREGGRRRRSRSRSRTGGGGKGIFNRLSISRCYKGGGTPKHHVRVRIAPSISMCLSPLLLLLLLLLFSVQLLLLSEIIILRDGRGEFVMRAQLRATLPFALSRGQLWLK